LATNFQKRINTRKRIILITNSETIFHVGSKARHLPVGEIFEVNNKRFHAVRNDGELDRIHFIFECYNMDDYGKLG
jgi:hypothetical protein